MVYISGSYDIGYKSWQWAGNFDKNCWCIMISLTLPTFPWLLWEWVLSRHLVKNPMQHYKDWADSLIKLIWKSSHGKITAIVMGAICLEKKANLTSIHTRDTEITLDQHWNHTGPTLKSHWKHTEITLETLKSHWSQTILRKKKMTLTALYH